MCTFREIWLTGNRQSRALFTWQKKQNFRKVSRSRFCADRAQNLSGQVQSIYSECPQFHPNPFNSGGVLAERTRERRSNTPQSVSNRPILGEASASSPSNHAATRKRIHPFTLCLRGYYSVPWINFLRFVRFIAFSLSNCRVWQSVTTAFPQVFFALPLGRTPAFVWSPYVIGQIIIFLPCDFYLCFLFLA